MMTCCTFVYSVINQAIRVSHSFLRIWSHLKQQTGPRKDLTGKKNNLSTKKKIFFLNFDKKFVKNLSKKF